MPKIYLDTEEWYPVWEIRDSPYGSYHVEISEELLQRVKQVFADFASVQEELEQLTEQQGAQWIPYFPSSPDKNQTSTAKELELRQSVRDLLDKHDTKIGK